MNIGEIESLARVLSAHGLTALEVTEGNLRVRLEKSGAAGAAASAAPRGAAADAPPEAAPADVSGLYEVKSPLVGVFYAAPSPESEPFTHVGAAVRKGDVLCILEAMKLMNEVTAERDGVIADVCVKNGDVAEYGQVLFRIAEGGGA